MKKIILASLALLAALAVPPARAWTYNDNDLLLVFRKSGHPNLEFDLGSVSNLLNHAAGYTTNLVGWDSTLVTGEFGTDLTGVKVILLAATSKANPTPTAWLSGAEPNTTAYNVSLSAWNANLQGIISAVGSKPLYPILIPTNGVNGYSIDPGGSTAYAAYDYIVTGGTLSSAKIPKLGGNASFIVEQAIPGSLDFWQIQPASGSPAPPDYLVGTIALATDGTLTFVAGPRAATVSGTTRDSNVSAVSFSTTVGNHYSLAFTNQLRAPVSTWPVDSQIVVGNGNVKTINHTNSGSAEFYRIIAQ
ncbi:MAG: hypothetical protein WCS94_09510 [Verrucomicrobiota bacterium]